MKIPTRQEIKDYYPLYMTAHRNKVNRRLHFFGQIFTLLFAATVLYFWLWFLIPLIPFVIYPFAWSGHLYFEKNKPATWNTNPLLTKACDWVMFYNICRGRVKIW